MDTDMWETHCKGKFDELITETKSIKKILVGNGEEGVVDAVRNHKRYFRCFWALAIFLGSLVAVQTAVVVRGHLTDDHSNKKIIEFINKVEAESRMSRSAP